MDTVDEKKAVVMDFLRRCNDYADGMLQKYQATLESDPGSDQIKLKLLKWQAYREYNEHAITELQGNELDDWFEE